jgi:hypothetical protein
MYIYISFIVRHIYALDIIGVFLTIKYMENFNLQLHIFKETSNLKINISLDLILDHIIQLIS